MRSQSNKGSPTLILESKVLLARGLATASSYSPLRESLTDNIRSGIELAAAPSIRPLINPGIPRNSALPITPSTRMSEPNTIITIAIASNIIAYVLLKVCH